MLVLGREDTQIRDLFSSDAVEQRRDDLRPGSEKLIEVDLLRQVPFLAVSDVLSRLPDAARAAATARFGD